MRRWTRWRCVTKKANYEGPAVYRIRLVNKLGEPIQINRFLSTDLNGLLAIGVAKTNMENRRKLFYRAFNNGRAKHSEGKLLYFIKNNSSSYKRYQNCQCQYSFWKLKSLKKAEKEEARLIKSYLKIFGEVPPLNSVIPKRSEN